LINQKITVVISSEKVHPGLR